jgi:HPt (histidine-containing phosphotransfer) domain-containing protein
MTSPQTNPLDVDALAELADDLGEAFPEFVHRFIDTAARELEAVDTALAAGDCARAATHAHALRGTAGYLGARLLAAALAALQGAAHGGDPAGALAHAAQARRALADVTPLLRTRAAGG